MHKYPRAVSLKGTYFDILGRESLRETRIDGKCVREEWRCSKPTQTHQQSKIATHTQKKKGGTHKEINCNAVMTNVALMLFLETLEIPHTQTLRELCCVWI